jgi:CheY-like chemotaxis protein
VVDDDGAIRRAVRKLLERHGYEVHECGDGAEALTILETNPPDILLTDLNMPGLDGMGLLRTLRRSGSKVRIIVFSGVGQGPVLDVAKQLGAHATLDKPFTAAQLLAVVAKVEVSGD